MVGAFFQEIQPLADGIHLGLVQVKFHTAQQVGRVVDPVAGQTFEQVHDGLPVTPGIHEEGFEAGFVGRHADPQEMAVDAFQLGHQHTDGLGARRGFHVRQFFDRQAVGHGVDMRTNPTDAFDQIQVLDPGALFGSLLDAAVGVSQAHVCAGDHFPIHRKLEMAGFLEGRVLRADRDGKPFVLTEDPVLSLRPLDNRKAGHLFILFCNPGGGIGPLDKRPHGPAAKTGKGGSKQSTCNRVQPVEVLVVVKAVDHSSTRWQTKAGSHPLC